MLTALTQFIPIMTGQSAFIKQQGLISNLLAKIGYEQTGDGYILFTEDITNTYPAVDIRLVVLDFSKYSDYDMLPLTADMAGEVVQAVSAMLLQTPPEDNKVDSTTPAQAQNK